MDLLEKCKAEFELLTRLQYDETNPIHVSVVEDMVAYKEVQQGNNGLKSLTLDGVTESYRDNYPNTVMRVISILRKRVQLL